MLTKTNILSAAILAFIFSCSDTNKPTQTNQTAHERHWSYSGETSPEHWIEIEKNSDCDGKHQSPINIIHIDTDSTASKKDLKIWYSPTTHISKAENNGHSIQFNFEAGDSINYKNETYYLNSSPVPENDQSQEQEQSPSENVTDDEEEKQKQEQENSSSALAVVEQLNETNLRMEQEQEQDKNENDNHQEQEHQHQNELASPFAQRPPADLMMMSTAATTFENETPREEVVLNHQNHQEQVQREGAGN